MKKNKGFTLIEVLVAMVILSVAGLALLSLQVILSQNQVLVFKNYLSIDDANNVVTTFTKEVRNARPGDNGSYPLEYVGDDQIIFYSDVDFDGNVDRVRYSVVNQTQLDKGVIKPVGFPATYPQDQEIVTTLSNNVRNLGSPAFYYYNGDWPNDTTNNPLVLSSRLSETRSVGINLRINPKENDADNDYVLESIGQIRMLKNNL